MSLQRKFLLLLTLLGLTVSVNLASTTWAVTVLERELSSYLASVEAVLGGLTRVKRLLAQVEPMVPDEFARPAVLSASDAESEAARAGGDTGSRFVHLRTQIHAELARLESVETHLVRSGSSTWRNLESRIDETLDTVETWLRTRDPAAAAEAGPGLFRVHELIERMESKIHADAGAIVGYGAHVRARVYLILAVTLAAVFAAGVLGTALVRRWVVRPVESLREAAERFARGEFSHRVPVGGRDELGLLSAEINQMAATIAAMQDERVERERLAAVGEMVRRIVHNLRNPLAGIRSLAELTREDLPEGSDQRESQERIIRTVDRFETWLGGLLRGTTPHAITPEPVCVPGWLAGIVEAHRAAADARGVRLNVDFSGAPATAAFDPRHLEQAVVAILTNAIQASPRSQTVEITARTDAAAWEIRVADHGPGIPPDLRGRIFEVYFTTKHDGTGIGLAMTKQIVEGHGGRILVENGQESGSEGPGAVFILRLPLAGMDRAGIVGPEVARAGQVDEGTGAKIGQDPDHRGRGEPEVLHPPGAAAGGA